MTGLGEPNTESQARSRCRTRAVIADAEPDSAVVALRSDLQPACGGIDADAVLDRILNQWLKRQALANTLGCCSGAGVGFALRDLPSGALTPVIGLGRRASPPSGC